MVAERSETQMTLRRPPGRLRFGICSRTCTGSRSLPPLPAGTSLAVVVADIARAPLLFQPGSQWKYGNAGMSVLGRIVEVVSGLSFPDFLQTRFFDPLGMADTTFFPNAGQLRRLATTYKTPKGGGSLEKAEIYLFPEGLASREHTVLSRRGIVLHRGRYFSSFIKCF